jgi:Family of unknown function (DUF6338)
VPTTLLGLVLFVVLLAPGFCYVLCKELARGTRTVSPFRETVTLAAISLACDAAVAAAFAVVRILLPSRTPDIGALVRHPADYVRGHYASLAWWGLGLLASACLLGVALASIESGAKIATVLRRIRGLRWLAPPANPVIFNSAWWRLFHEHEDSFCYVGCHLDDGSFLSGWLFSYASDDEETGDRELTISAPVFFRPAGEVDGEELAIGAVAISARRIVSLFVTYVEDQNGPASASIGDEGPQALPEVIGAP